MLDEDEKLAKKLQEQFYSEVTKESKPYTPKKYPVWKEMKGGREKRREDIFIRVDFR